MERHNQSGHSTKSTIVVYCDGWWKKKRFGDLGHNDYMQGNKFELVDQDGDELILVGLKSDLVKASHGLFEFNGDMLFQYIMDGLLIDIDNEVSLLNAWDVSDLDGKGCLRLYMKYMAPKSQTCEVEVISTPAIVDLESNVTSQPTQDDSFRAPKASKKSKTIRTNRNSKRKKLDVESAAAISQERLNDQQFSFSEEYLSQLFGWDPLPDVQHTNVTVLEQEPGVDGAEPVVGGASYPYQGYTEPEFFVDDPEMSGAVYPEVGGAVYPEVGGADPSKTRNKRKKMKTVSIVLDEEQETVADITELPEEELDVLPDLSFRKKKTPASEENNSSSSESDEEEQVDEDEDSDFVLGDEDEDTISENYSDWVDDVSQLGDEDDFEGFVEPPKYHKYKGCSKICDDLYTDKEAGIQDADPLGEEMLEKGMVWPSLSEFKRFFATYCVTKRFEVYMEKSDKKRFRAKCKGNNKTCPWTILVSKNPYDDQCKVKTLKAEHTCQANIRGKNTMADSNWVSFVIEKDIRENEVTFTPKSIKNRIQNAHGIPISYFIAWKARGKALDRVYGSYEDGYKMGPEICNQIKISNPGSIATCNCENTSTKFANLCIALKPMLEGFVNGCRPLVGLDGCHLKGKYGGVLLSAVALDGNNGLFPLAWFWCSVEDTYNWKTFLRLLFPLLSEHPHTLTFMSDSQKGLKRAVVEEFPGCEHRYCFRHLYKNFKKSFRGDQLMILSWGAAKAFRTADYEKWMTQIYEAIPEAYDWYVSQSPEYWARSFFNTTSKCEHVTNNFSESFNSWIGELRDKPLQRFVDDYVNKVMVLMYERKMIAQQWGDDDVVPRAKRIIDRLSLKIRNYRVVGAEEFLFAVFNLHTGERWMVHMEHGTCSCRVWDLCGIPCVHAIAVIDELRQPVSKFCHKYHSVETYRKVYEGHINPLANKSEWGKPTYTVSEPTKPNAAGRPRTARRRDPDEPTKKNAVIRHCKSCGATGHNSAGCRGPNSVKPRKFTNLHSRGGGPPPNITSSFPMAQGRGAGGRGRGTRGRGRGDSAGRGRAMPPNTTTTFPASQGRGAGTKGKGVVPPSNPTKRSSVMPPNPTGPSVRDSAGPGLRAVTRSSTSILRTPAPTSQPTVGSSSSQPIFGSSSSQPAVSGSSSQPIFGSSSSQPTVCVSSSQPIFGGSSSQPSMLHQHNSTMIFGPSPAHLADMRAQYQRESDAAAAAAAARKNYKLAYGVMPDDVGMRQPSRPPQQIWRPPGRYNTTKLQPIRGRPRGT